jgi:hypothetical protein
MEDLPDDLQSRLGYRIAYGEAARLAEIARFDHGYGRDFAARVGDQAESIQREVMRRVSPGVHPELVKLAVEDALEGRRPPW